jgi:Escherichia/Staphylococcus phage prohead protease
MENSNDNKRELRYAPELRQKADGQAKHLFGYAAVYSTPTVIGGQFIEILMQGCFERSLAANPDIRCLFGHSDLNVLGRSSAGTLKVHADDKGLYYDCELPDTEAANSLWVSVQRKDITGSSFAFFPVKENWIPASKPGELPTRQILDVELDGGDVSPVTYPAYLHGTSVSARSMPEQFRAASTSHLGVVPFSSYDARSERSYSPADEANGIINWADGEDEDRAADAPVKNKLKAAAGFLYVANQGEKRSDYIGPHHTIVDGSLAHSQVGTLRCAMSLATGKLVDIPAEHRAAAKQHIDSELSVWMGDGSADGDVENEIERSRARVRLTEAKATL